MNKRSGNTPDRAEQTARNRQNEYPGVDELLDDFINNGSTRGHTSNLIIYGDTLYVNRGNIHTELFYYQLVIRASDDVYFVNSRDMYSEHIDKILDLLTKHIRAWRILMPLPTTHNKVLCGVVEPATLSTVLIGETKPHTRKVIKEYAKANIRNEAVANLKKLIDTLEILDSSPWSNFCNTREQIRRHVASIEEILDQVQKAKESCENIDKYLEILKQLPEQPT